MAGSESKNVPAIAVRACPASPDFDLVVPDDDLALTTAVRAFTFMMVRFPLDLIIPLVDKRV